MAIALVASFTRAPQRCQQQPGGAPFEKWRPDFHLITCQPEPPLQRPQIHFSEVQAPATGPPLLSRTCSSCQALSSAQFGGQMCRANPPEILELVPWGLSSKNLCSGKPVTSASCSYFLGVAHCSLVVFLSPSIPLQPIRALTPFCRNSSWDVCFPEF